MVSLGPLTDAKDRYYQCRCKFCYVQGPFPKYAQYKPGHVIDWLEHRIAEHADFDVVYVSGDTDSFARPRTQQGLELLERLLSLSSPVDVLFTTRYVFTSPERDRLAELVEEYRKARRTLIPCISVSQLHYADLEPRPIPTPDDRIGLVKWLHGIGAQVALTVRPFIPYIPADDYAEIVRRVDGECSVVLGGDWHTDVDGRIDSLTRAALEPHLGQLDPLTPADRPERLDFSTDSSLWYTHVHPTAEQVVRAECERQGLRFFMRSSPAVDFLRRRS
jgi:DNA repair photolyase